MAILATRNKNEDVGIKKAQKQDIIQNGRIFVILYPFLYSTQYYSHIIDHGLWNVGMVLPF